MKLNHSVKLELRSQRVSWNKSNVKPLKSSPRSDPTLRRTRTSAESKKRRWKEKELTKSRPKLSHPTRKTSRSIGLGKSSKRKKTVKSSLRTSRSRRKLANLSFFRRMSWSKASWSSWEIRMRSTSSLEWNKMMILMSWFFQWKGNLMTWEPITPIN